MYYYNYDTLITYFLLIIGIVVVGYAQAKISSAYNKYRRIKNSKGLTGADIAHEILNANGLDSIYVVEIGGTLTDNYDSSRKVLHLSQEVFRGDSLASVAVAAHECGHAIQDKENYKPLHFRSFLVPIINFVNYIGYFVILIGLLGGIESILIYGILTLLATLLFQLVTLPVEYNATARAQKELRRLHLIAKDEEGDIKEMLSAAALTYVASTISTVMNLFRLLLIRGNRDDR